MGQCCTRENEERTTIDKKPLMYRWFRAEGPFWAPFPVDISEEIEKAHGQMQEEYKIGDCCFKFCYRTHQYFQITQNDPLRKLELKRDFPKHVKNVLRATRMSINEPIRVKPYQPSQIDQFKIFSYSELFDQTHTKLDHTSKFIKRFCSFSALLDNQLISLLTKEYVNYLTNFHLITENIFDFGKIKSILEKDMNRVSSLNPYTVFVKDLTEASFTETIVQMYTDEGDLGVKLNQGLRTTLKDNLELVFFYLCLQFAFDNRKKIMGDIVVYQATSVNAEVYERYISEVYIPGNVIVNYDFTSTTKSIQLATACMGDKHNQTFKNILLEIRIAKERFDKPFLSLKPFDLEGISLFNEREVLLPPNGIFQVREFPEQNNEQFTLIQLDYKTNLFTDTLPFFINQNEFTQNLGLYTDASLIDHCNCNQVISVKLQKHELKLVDRFPSLQHLDLHKTDLIPAEIRDVCAQISNIPNLIHLDMSENYFKEEGIKALCLSAQLNQISQLKNIDVSMNQIGVGGMISLVVQFQQLRNLEILNLKCNQLGDDGTTTFSSHVHLLKNLKWLDLSQNQVGNGGMKSLACGIKQLSKLQVLYLSENQIGDEGMREFSKQVQYLPQIIELDFEKNKIGISGIKAFSETFCNIVHLQSLNFASNQIGGEGIKHLASQFHHTPKLQKLNLSYNPIGNDGMHSFAVQCHELNNIERLYFSNVQITSEGVCHILLHVHHLPGLVEFNLRGNKIGEDQANELLTELQYLNSLWTMDNLMYICPSRTNIIDRNELFYEQFLKKNRRFTEVVMYSHTISNNEESSKNAEYYKGVKKLNLQENRLGPDGMQDFSKKFQYCKSLLELYLNFNLIGNEGMKAFSSELHHLDKLHVLNLEANLIEDEAIQEFSLEMHHLSSIKRLDFTNNRIGPKGIEYFSRELSHLKDLEALNLSQNQIGTEGMKVFSIELHRLDDKSRKPQTIQLNISKLNFNSNQIGSEGLRAFAAEMNHLPRLQEFSCNDNQLWDEGLKAFTTYLHFVPLLQDVSFSHNQIGNEGLKAFSEQLHLIPMIQKINISGNDIGDPGFKAFAKALGNNQLNNFQIIEAGENKIGDAGMIVFCAQLDYLQNLKQIDFNSNLLGDESMKSLATQAIHLKLLQHLDLSRNMIGNKGFKAFTEKIHNLLQLESLNLVENQIGDNEMKAIAARFAQYPNSEKIK